MWFCDHNTLNYVYPSIILLSVISQIVTVILHYPFDLKEYFLSQKNL